MTLPKIKIGFINIFLQQCIIKAKIQILSLPKRFPHRMLMLPTMNNKRTCVKKIKCQWFPLYVFQTDLPKFHTHPESMSVDEGGVARFQCQVNSIPEANITWEKDQMAISTLNGR